TEPTINAYGVGAITALGGGSISVTGDRTLTCTLGPDSPSLTEFHVGDHVKIGCRNGVLYGIVRTDTPPATTTTASTTTAKTVTDATGPITTLSVDRVSVGGEHPLSCPIGDGSPSTDGFHIGDYVRMYCVNGGLYALIKVEAPGTTTTQTTTTNPIVYTAATGTITALTDGSITVTGEHTLTCPIGASSPSTAGFHV